MMCIDCRARPTHARGRCNACYHVYRHSDAYTRVYQPRHQPCHCGQPAFARGLCQMHYMRAYRSETAR
jgi:hypothetical protein